MTSFSGTSAPDKRRLQDLRLFGKANNGFADLTGRTQRYPSLTGTNTAAVITDGQSNGGNPGVGTLYTVANPTKIKNLNILNGAVYDAVPPLLGGGGPGNSFAIQAIDTLISNGKLDDVIIAPINVGATTAEDHAPGGFLYHRHAAVCEGLKALNLHPKYIWLWWHLGESNCINGTRRGPMSALLRSIFAVYKAEIPQISIFIAKTSYAFGVTSPDIIAAQQEQIDNVSVFDLGDFDVIPSANRISDIDYDPAGCTQAAGIVVPKITSFLLTH